MNRNTIMTSKFKWQVTLVWLALMIGFIWFIAKFDLDMAYVWEKLPFLAGLHLSPDGFIQGVPLTIYVCVIAMLASVILGLLAALGRLSLNPLAYGISTFYTSFFRGTPLLLQVLLIYQGLPQIGPIPTAIPSGIIALALCYGAYLSEIFRSAIVAIPRGQWEAAMALGLKTPDFPESDPATINESSDPAGHGDVHCDAERLVTGFSDGLMGNHVSGPKLRPFSLPLHGNANHGGSDLLDSLFPAGTDSGAVGESLPRWKNALIRF